MKKKTNQGFTIVELMVASGLSSALVLGTIYFVKVKQKELSITQVSQDSLVTSLNFEKRIRKDFIDIKYSYNALNVLDDSGNKFFDFYPDGDCATACSRTLTLAKPTTAGNFSKPIYILTKDGTSSIEQVYDPNNAYTAKAYAPTDAASLAFSSLNNNHILEGVDMSPWTLTTAKPQRLILLYSPVYTYPDQVVGAATPPGRSLGFLGWRTSTNLSGALTAEVVKDTVTGAPTSSVFSNINPKTNTAITNEDTLFKSIPSIKGLATISMIAPVKVIRYRILAQQTSGSKTLVGVLMRAELTSAGTFTEIAMASGIDQLVFDRSTIINPTIRITFTLGK